MEDNAWKWVVRSVLAVLALVIAFFGGGLAERTIWSPDVVYQISQRETMLGPKMTQEYRKALVRTGLSTALKVMTQDVEALKQELEEVADDEEKVMEKLMELFVDMPAKAAKKQLLAEMLLPDKYVEVRIGNRGRDSADNLSFVLKVPGAIVEQYVQCPAYPNPQVQSIDAWDGEIPVGIEIDKSQIPQMAGGDELTVEVWYSEHTMTEDERAVVRDWPPDISVEIRHDQGAGREIDPLASSPLPAVKIAYTSLALALAFTLAWFAFAVTFITVRALRSRRPSNVHDTRGPP